MDKIRVMLVDDHDVVRTGIKALLETETDMEVVDEARDGMAAITRAMESRPDVIVMDITMPKMDGLEATRQLTVRCPKSLVLALTVHEDKQYLFEMLRAGAKGYITKQAAAEELVAAVRAIAAGNVYLEPALARWLLEDYRRLMRQEPTGEDGTAHQLEMAGTGLDVLSKRELQVVELVAEGLTTPRIAARLDISPKTVSRHRERIMKKLNLHTSTELVKFAIRTGLIDLKQPL